nr:hypothetical protein [Tanacetum cinerariifolium]
RVTDVRTNANANLSNSQSNSFDLQQILDIQMNRFEKSLIAPLKAVTEIAAALEDKLAIRMNRFEKSLIDMKNSLVTPTAPLKAVTEDTEPQNSDDIHPPIVQVEVPKDKPADEPVV